MMNNVLSKAYGMRPLLDMPSLDAQGRGLWQACPQQNDLSMAPAPLFRKQGHDIPPAVGVSHSVMGLQPAAYNQGSHHYAGIPGQLFCQYPTVLPPKVINLPPTRLQPPSHPITDVDGNLVPVLTGSPQLQPAVPAIPMLPVCTCHLYTSWPHNPYQAQGCCMAGPVHHCIKHPQPQNFNFEGVLQFGKLTTVRLQDKANTPWKLPDILRRELEDTYHDVPVTDIRIVVRNGEYRIYAKARIDKEKKAISRSQIIHLV